MIPAGIVLAVGLAILVAGWHAIRSAENPYLAYFGAALIAVGLVPAGVGSFALLRLVF